MDDLAYKRGRRDERHDFDQYLVDVLHHLAVETFHAGVKGEQENVEKGEFAGTVISELIDALREGQHVGSVLAAANLLPASDGGRCEAEETVFGQRLRCRLSAGHEGVHQMVPR